MLRSLVVALPAAAFAAVCTEADYMPLVSGIVACTSASGINGAVVHGVATPADIAKMCQHPACQALFASMSSLRCTDREGKPLSVAGSVCEPLGGAATVKPAAASTPAATNSGFDTVVSIGTVVVSAAAALML